MKPNTWIVLATLTLGNLGATAQSAHVAYHDPFTPAVWVTDQPMATSPCGTLVTQAPVNPGYAMLALGATPTPLGGHAFDQMSDVVYVSDGLSIEVVPHPLYVPGTGPCPPLKVQCIPGVYLYAKPGGFGNITGMAFQQGNALCPAVLWVTDGTLIMGLSPCPAGPAFPFTVFPVAGPVTPSGAPLTGLEVESGLGLIVAVDQAGWTHLIPDPRLGCSSLPPGLGGNLPPPAPLLPFPVPPFYNSIIGNVLDRSVPGYEVWITDGATMWCAWGAVGTIALPPVLFVPRGASFSSEPLVLKSCGTTYSTLESGTSDPLVGGTVVIFWMTCPAALVGSTALLAFGPCTPVSLIPADCSGCLWLIDPFLMNFYPAPVVAFGALGSACLFAPIPNMVGFTGYAQWAVLDPFCALGYRVSDVLHGRVSAP